MKCCHHFQDETNVKKLCISIVPIFNHLSEEEMCEIAKLSISKRYHKGELVFQPGEVSDHLSIIHKGRVKIYRISESGKEQLLRILEPGDFVGELNLFSQGSFDRFAEATVESEICTIQRQELHNLILKYPMISLKILEEFSNRLNRTEKLVSRLSSQDVEKRTASYLVELAEGEEGSPVTVTLPMSKKDLASYLGTTQETISRKFSSFQERGWIEQTGQRNITILDMESLAQKAEE